MARDKTLDALEAALQTPYIGRGRQSQIAPTLERYQPQIKALLSKGYSKTAVAKILKGSGIAGSVDSIRDAIVKMSEKRTTQPAKADAKGAANHTPIPAQTLGNSGGVKMPEEGEL